MERNKVIIVTGFEPFGKDIINPTQIIVNRLPDYLDEYQIIKLVLPVEFIKAPQLLINLYDRIQPQAVIMLGQAGERKAISIETTAVNLMNVKEGITDNSGYAPYNLPLIKEGKEKIESTLPIDKLIDSLNQNHIPCELSSFAGTFVCNAVFYQMMHHVNSSIPAGFIHVPFIKEQGHVEQYPFMELDDIYKGVMTIVKTLIEYLEK